MTIGAFGRQRQVVPNAKLREQCIDDADLPQACRHVAPSVALVTAVSFLRTPLLWTMRSSTLGLFGKIGAETYCRVGAQQCVYAGDLGLCRLS